MLSIKKISSNVYRGPDSNLISWFCFSSSSSFVGTSACTGYIFPTWIEAKDKKTNVGTKYACQWMFIATETRK